jgi:hypothetical protein
LAMCPPGHTCEGDRSGRPTSNGVRALMNRALFFQFAFASGTTARELPSSLWQPRAPVAICREIRFARCPGPSAGPRIGSDIVTLGMPADDAGPRHEVAHTWPNLPVRGSSLLSLQFASGSSGCSLAKKAPRDSGAQVGGNRPGREVPIDDRSLTPSSP